MGERMVNMLTGRRPALRPDLPGAAEAAAPPAAEAKSGAGKVQLTIFGLVVLAWLIGAGLGYMTNRPVALAGTSVSGSGTPAPSLTASPATTPSPAPKTTPTPSH